MREQLHLVAAEGEDALLVHTHRPVVLVQRRLALDGIASALGVRALDAEHSVAFEGRKALAAALAVVVVVDALEFLARDHTLVPVCNGAQRAKRNA